LKAHCFPFPVAGSSSSLPSCVFCWLYVSLWENSYSVSILPSPATHQDTSTYQAVAETDPEGVVHLCPGFRRFTASSPLNGING
ncbi:hypothetical protein GOODEAATRI_026557, partial [Goodea atripinnis]